MRGPPLPPRPRSSLFSAVPPKVTALILLSIPINVATGFFFIVVSAYLLMVGLTADLVGLILGVSGVTMILAAIPLGLLSDRRGRKVLLFLGALGFPPVLVVFALTTEPLYLVLAGALAGVAEAAFLSTWNALIADGTPPEGRNAAFSLSFVVGTTTSGVGFAFPFLFPFLEAWTGIDTFTIHRGFLFLFALVAAITPVAFRLFLWDLPEVRRPRRMRARPESLGLLMKFSVSNGLIGLGAGFIIPLIPTWLFLKFTVPDSYSGPLLAIANLTMGLAGFASTALARRQGPVRAIVATQGLSTVFMVSLAFVPHAALAGGLYIIRAALMNMASPIMDAYLMGIIAPGERGFASALNSIIWRLPNSVSTIAGGIILASGNYELPFLLAAALYVVAIVMFYALFRNVKPAG